MNNRYAESLVTGITKHEDLKRRMLMEIGALPAGCAKCKKDSIVRKYYSLVYQRNINSKSSRRF